MKSHTQDGPFIITLNALNRIQPPIYNRERAHRTFMQKLAATCATELRLP